MNKKIILLISIILFSQLSCVDGLLDTYDNSKLYSLRDRGPAGGWIFYINPNYKTDGWRYLEAAPVDQNGGIRLDWGTNPLAVQGADGLAIGTGKQNTIDIKAGDSFLNKAADICVNYRGGDYSDWFLPSRDELQAIWWNLISDHSSANSGRGQPYSGSVGNFNGDYYWSSSEATLNNACLQRFDDGTPNTLSKSSARYVRAVRAF